MYGRVNLNLHEQNHTKKKNYVTSLKMMACDSFAFMTLVNELENQAINRRTIHGLVGKVARHLRRMIFNNKGKCLEKVYLVFFCLR